MSGSTLPSPGRTEKWRTCELTETVPILSYDAVYLPFVEPARVLNILDIVSPARK